MKTTMYELLGMVKDGKAPARILYDGYIWSWTGDDYKTILRDEKEQFLITGMYYEWFTDFIKAEVEILEEPKGIPEKLDMVLLGQSDNWTQKYNKDTKKMENTDIELNPYVIDIIRENTLEIQHKFNEIIDYLESKGE